MTQKTLTNDEQRGFLNLIKGIMETSHVIHN